MQVKWKDFLECTLKQTRFESCDLNRAKFSHTSLNTIDLSSSEFDAIAVSIDDIKGAIVNESQALGFLEMLQLKIKDWPAHDVGDLISKIWDTLS